jgi:uncharacterized protein YdaL
MEQQVNLYDYGLTMEEFIQAVKQYRYEKERQRQKNKIIYYRKKNEKELQKLQTEINKIDEKIT